jgi:hypothetical protein
MYWWNQAAKLLEQGKIKRFGFIATNSLRQTFNRRILESHLEGHEKISLIYAIPDHPWVESADGAAVRISMTVARKGDHNGTLLEVRESNEQVELIDRFGKINPDLTIGSNVTAAQSLQANSSIAGRGVQLMGSGFIVTAAQAKKLGLGKRRGLENHIRQYLNGKDLTDRSRNALVIDLFGLRIEDVQKKYPEVYQHLVEFVKPERDVNRRATYRNNWWIHGEPRSAFRPALVGLNRYIATVETSKHRFFQFIDSSVLPDNRLVNIASDDAFVLGVLSSRFHVTWALRNGGTLEDRPVYTKSRCFDTFPFPDTTEKVKRKIATAAEELDKFRKERIESHSETLTMTSIYNVAEKIKTRSALSSKEKAIYDAGLISVLLDIHRRLDEAVAEAYSMTVNLDEEQILERLLSLNSQRVREEKSGNIKYIRKEYQAASHDELELDVEIETESGSEADPVKPLQPVQWPKSMPDQVASVRKLLETASIPVTLKELGRYFVKVDAAVLEEIIEVLHSLGKAEKIGEDRYSSPTRALKETA